MQNPFAIAYYPLIALIENKSYLLLNQKLKPFTPF
jgi:hypothetical protein